ncbi:MAG: AMP-dependent synthetase/ligase [Myxococcota bacterium]
MPDFKPKYNTLVEIYESSVRRFQDNPLFGTKQGGEWTWMTYGEFGQRVDAARGGLASLGVTEGDRVAVITNNRPEWAIGAYATYGLGAAYVPMYESQLDKDWKFILNDCGAKVLVVANEGIRDRVDKLREGLSSLEHVIVCDGQGGSEGLTFDELLDRGRKAPVDVVDVQPDATAGFIYTSGTTGNPKGVLLSHGNIASNVSAMEEVFPMQPDDRSLSFLPWAHSFGQSVELHGLFLMGASMAIAEAVDKIVDNLGEVKPTLLFSVPRIFNRIYDGLQKRMAEEGGLKKKLFEAAMANEERRKELAAQGKSSGVADLKHNMFDKVVFSKVRERFGGRLKYAFSGGAALSREVAEFIDNLGIMVYEGYGLTETSPIATANWPGSRKIGSVGRSIPGVHVKIDLAATGDPKNGEIIICGHNVMQGYHHLPEENEKVFTEEGCFRTGDMGHLDDDGFLYITGRVKEQYKLENGKYVVPTPLEEHLKLSPFISNAMVYGDNKPYNVGLIIPDMDTLQKWASEQGLDTSDPQKLIEQPQVRERIREEIERHSSEFKQYEKLKDFTLQLQDFTTENGMLTPTLKVKRRVVIDQFGDQIQKLYDKQAKQSAA